MKRLPFIVLVAWAAGCQQACPSPAGGVCDPRNPNCPPGYHCAMAEVCTQQCQVVEDCWIHANNGCRETYFPGQTLPDGGYFQEVSEDGYCPETKLMECVGGYCQRRDYGDAHDYDLYGPSPFKGNRSQGPEE